MKLKNLRDKYGPELEELEKLNSAVEQEYLEIHENADRVFEYMTQLEGKYQSFTDEEFNEYILQSIGFIKNMFRNVDYLAYKIKINEQKLNGTNLNVAVIYDILEQYEDIEGLKKEIEELSLFKKKFERFEIESDVFKELTEVAGRIDKKNIEEKQIKNSDKEGIEVG